MVIKMKFVTEIVLLLVEDITATLMNRAYSHLWTRLSYKVLAITNLDDHLQFLNDYENYFSTEIFPGNTEGADAFYNIINNIQTFYFFLQTNIYLRDTQRRYSCLIILPHNGDMLSSARILISGSGPYGT